MADSKEGGGGGPRMESTCTCFAHRNYRELFHSNTSELFDFEDSHEVNGLLQGSLQALLPNVHHRDVIHLSNPSLSVCMLRVPLPPPTSQAAVSLGSEVMLQSECGCLADGRIAEGLEGPCGKV